jgi:molecular chaperone GrpE
VGTSDGGKFETDIPQDVIREALDSVQKRVAPAEEPQPEGLEVEVGPGDEGAPGAGELESVRVELELSQAKGRELMDKLRETHDRMLRSVADLENFKKRALKEKEEVQKFGAERLLRDFLPVVDNLERALDAAKTATDFDSLKTGVAMTHKQFVDALGKHGVDGFSAVGQSFDPRLHEAMQQVETTQVPPNHVLSELVRGYTLNERLIRPALVVVARAPAQAPSGSSDGEQQAQ